MKYRRTPLRVSAGTRGGSLWRTWLDVSFVGLPVEDGWADMFLIFVCVYCFVAEISNSRLGSLNRGIVWKQATLVLALAKCLLDNANL